MPRIDAVRCARSPDGRLIADFHHKLPCARPLWLGMRPEVLRRVVDHDLASAWFGQPTAAGEVFIEQCRASAQKAVYDALPMLHKSGACVLGLESVMQALDADVLRLIIIATNAGTSDQRKLTNPRYSAIPRYHFGTKELLGRRFGRHAQVFIGVMHGDMAEKLGFFLRCNTGFL